MTSKDVHLLLQGILAPLDVAESKWERLLRLARMSGLHARLAETNLGNPRLSDAVRRHLLSSARVAAYRRQMLRAELSRLAPLCDADFPVLVLKGGAYVLQRRPMAEGRFVSDVDLLVPRQHLHAMERRLLAAGWQAQELNAYDERYYRDWSHETPPMRYPDALLEVDLHHAITPVTGSLAFDPAPLFEASESVPGTPFRVLCPEDQVLHACLHCFHDGELDLRVREVVDIDGLLREFAGSEGFWQRLVRRAAHLGLERPLWYGLRYAGKWLDCPVPGAIVEALPAPSPVVRRAMDALLPLALFPSDPDRPVSGRISAARAVLQVRYHLLRMPPRLLLPHLARKSVRRLRARLGGNSGTENAGAPLV